MPSGRPLCHHNVSPLCARQLHESLEHRGQTSRESRHSMFNGLWLGVQSSLSTKLAVLLWPLLILSHMQHDSSRNRTKTTRNMKTIGNTIASKTENKEQYKQNNPSFRGLGVGLGIPGSCRRTCGPAKKAADPVPSALDVALWLLLS